MALMLYAMVAYSARPNIVGFVRNNTFKVILKMTSNTYTQQTL